MNRFVIADPRLCIGCNTCMAACSEEHKMYGLQTEPRLVVVKNSRDSVPVMCHQCEDAPCAQVCPVNAITHTNDSIQLNESLCVSCKLCGIACPFGAITMNGSKPLHIPANSNTPMALPAPPNKRGISPFLDWYPGIRSIAVKCDLCQFSEQGPACVRACPTHAIMLVDDNQLSQASAAKRQNAMDAMDADLMMFSSFSEGSDAQ